MKAPILASAVVAAGLATLAYFAKVRPWYLRWGATETDVARTMPLDERVPDPTLTSTMAITIAAPPAEVWPWLAQIGDPPRAGYYSYTWLERLVGLRIENAGVLLPEFQSLRVGEAVDKQGTMVVQAVEPGLYLVLGPPPSVKTVNVTWAFVLEPAGEGATRLITRVRGAMDYRQMLRETPPLTWPFWLLIEPGAFIMERKMLREIKRLAEAGKAQPSREPLPGLAVGSARRFLRLAAAGRLHARRDRLGATYAVDQGGAYRIFHETVSSEGAARDPVVLVVGFRLRLIRSLPALHWLFQRVCLLTTPFWSGFRGFRVKLWMVEPRTQDYLGIYEWDGEANAQTYADALVRVLRPLSTPGSVWYEMYPAQELEAFLSARRVEPRTAAGATRWVAA